MKKVIFCLLIWSAFCTLNAQYSVDCETAIEAIDEYVTFLKGRDYNGRRDK